MNASSQLSGLISRQKWRGFCNRNVGKIERKYQTSSSLRFEVKSPASGKLVDKLEEDSISSIKEKSKKAQLAQREWSKVELKKKISILQTFGENLAKKEEELAKILSSETGKPVSQAKGEIKGVQPRIKFFVENVESSIQSNQVRKTDSFEEQVRREPLGVIANISAWNYPYFVGANVFVPALLTGNAILYKPSEYSSLTGIQIAKLLHESGVPKDVFQTVLGEGKVGESLLQLPEVNGVFFTGSLATGKKIAKTVGERMLRLQLELGGKDPTYVSHQVDVAKAAAGLADGAFYNTGQSCCSVERIYVHEKVYDQFVELFVKEVKGFKVGDPSDSSTYIGPLTLPKQVQTLEAQVADAVKKGAKVLTGGKKLNQPGNWFEPTVLVNVNHSMDVMMEESFGPIIGIQKVSNVDEAIALMNDCKYGLTSGVYTKSREEADKVMSEIQSGTVYWNACDRVSPFTPWSGRRGSGVGSTLGTDGILAFTQPKAWHLINP
eukprot:TRINITY_DN3588_c0_g1_i1.p1 TRINITY_DN3588_c0_g1~~TRINITY_DN3588_c0_g1_i1.p1  ORF type:complete len:508 (-),score=218.25 TRINITY_DN3588_c0_g1_i1:1532-3013(-)